MEFKRKPTLEKDKAFSIREPSGSTRAYEAYPVSAPAKKTSGFKPNWITAIAAVPLVAVVIYFSTDPSNPTPTVERVDAQTADRELIEAQQKPTQQKPTESKVLPQPSFSEFNTALTPDINNMTDLRAEFQKTQQEADQALAKTKVAPEADTEWSVEGFDQASLDILAKNTQVWAQMARLEADKAEIARAQRMVKTFKLSDAGQIILGSAGRATGTTRDPASESKSCTLTKPRSPDPQCRAKHPCRICGGCCCMCEAVLSGLATLGG